MTETHVCRSLIEMEFPQKTLFVFNPEHDLALAVGNNAYTPPAEVSKLKRDLALLPAIYAGNSDFILLPADFSPSGFDSSPFIEICRAKKLSIIHPEKLKHIGNDIFRVIPWGWDHYIRNFLLDAGINKDLLPDLSFIDEIRRLSHRRLSIDFKILMAEESGESPRLLPREIFHEEEIPLFLERFPASFFKAPWSSSGRGIISSRHIARKGLLEWCHGVIKKQGSLIAEPAWDKAFDFATEWWVENSEVKFMGYSVFKASSRGKYHENVVDSQDNLLKMIMSKVPDFNNSIVARQADIISRLISPTYEGPLGIDMLADREGNINPCVEINLRMTMGLVGIPDFPLFLQRTQYNLNTLKKTHL